VKYEMDKRAVDANYLVIMMRRWRRRTMNYTEDFQISDPFSEGFLVLKFK